MREQLPLPLPDLVLGPEPSLHEVLDALGLRTEPAKRHGAKRIIAPDGAVLITERAHEVWLWLAETGRYP